MLLNFLIVGFLVSATLISARPSQRALPTPVSAAEAMTLLAGLTVAVDSNVPVYNRSLFKTWDIITGTCNTREMVLIRDGTNVVTNSACMSTSGTWVSPYDDITVTVSRHLDIDHLVPLKEAWVSGARDWTSAQREAFANDLTRPQLVAVTASVNRIKGDKDPANWLPPVASFHCIYVRAWVQVKSFYSLTIDSAELSALTSILAGC